MSDKQKSSPIDQYVIDFVMHLRREKRQTQDDIADILQVSRSFVKDVENVKNRAKYNLAHINALADYYNMSPGDFLPAKPFPVKNKDEKLKKKTALPRTEKTAAKKRKKE